MKHQTNRPFVNVGIIAAFPPLEKIDKIDKIFKNFKWEFKVEQKNNVIIFALFFGNLNYTRNQILNEADYSLISFTDKTYECVCTICDIKYTNLDRKTPCTHLLQNIISIKKYIDSTLINPASSIGVDFKLGLAKKKKYASKSYFNIFVDISINDVIDFIYVVKSKDHLIEIIEMIARRKINLNDDIVMKKINYFYIFINEHQLSVADFYDTKKIIELICLFPNEVIHFMSIIYYDQNGSRKEFNKLELATNQKLKIEICLVGDNIVAKQQHLIYDYTNVFEKNMVNVLALDANDSRKILIFKENINETFQILNFEEMSYKTMKAFYHNFETIRDSIDTSRIINTLNMPNIDNLSESEWNFTIVIDDLIENKHFDNTKSISVIIILNIGEEKYNIIETNIYPWFKYLNEDLLNKLLVIPQIGEIYKNEKVIFNLNNQEELLILENQITEINKSKKVEILINSNYISGGRKSKFGFRPKIVHEKLIIDVELENYTKQEIDEIIKAYRSKLSLTKLKSGKVINFSNIDFDALSDDLNYFNEKIDDIDYASFETPNSNIFFAASLYNNSTEVHQFVTEFNDYQPISQISKKLSKFLKDYQLEGYLWMKKMMEFNFGCLLADDMGVGKTVQTIAIFDDLIKTNPKVKILIVCPVTLMYNWEKEIGEHIPNIKIVQVEGRKENRDTILAYSTATIFITSYTMLSKDIEYYCNIGLTLMVIDEAQVIKNSDTQISKSIREVPSKSRIALSGTPIENNLGELWSIMDFLNPSMLGSKKEFYNNYEKDIYNGDLVKQEALKKIVQSFFLRRTKQDVLADLPSKVEKIYSIDFEIGEEEIYNSFIEYIRLEMKTQENSREKSTFLFKTILKLRQICCDSRLIGESLKESSKLKFLIKNIKSIISEDSKNKIIVFSQFTSMLDLIQMSLKNNNIKYKMLTGKTPRNDRGQLIEDFNKDETNVILISLKAGGYGLNITSANHVFHYDPWWNIAAEMQATDRAHRIGQKKSVFVYKLIMKNSLEERILTIQYKKHELFKTFIESAGENKMNLESLCELIGI